MASPAAADAAPATRLSAKEQEAVRLASSQSVPIDNPCWGGPRKRQHDLQHLLRQIDAGAFGGSASLVLYEDENYVAIAKPPDLRMDGPQPATVHKLLTYWYPPPSLLQRPPAERDEHVVPSSSSSGGSFNAQLADQISKLAKHSDLSDNALRPCHQLDFATSGVLLVARSRKAARVACRAFEERTTSKEYVALVCGHVGTKSGTKSSESGGDEKRATSSAIPILPQSALSGWTDGALERAYRKKRNNAQKQTFEGFMPVHSIFGKWKAETMKRNRLEAASLDPATVDNKLRRKRSRTGEGDAVHEGDEKSESPADTESTLLHLQTPLTTDEEAKLLALNWKEVKKEGKHVLMFQDMATKFNVALSKRKQEEQDNEVVSNNEKVTAAEKQHLPNVFRIEGEEDNALYIHAPLCEISGHFRVYLDESSIPSSHPFKDYYTSTPDDERKQKLDFKPSLTRCVVLWEGTYKGEPVSKLLLQPRTGRRHQLRLHLALLNNPILGDVTYVPRDLDVADCHRMCLHAHKLSLPLLGGERKNFVAPDPFGIFDDQLSIAGEDNLARDP